MRLIRFGEKGNEKPGVLTAEGLRVDASGEFHDYNEVFFAGGGMEMLARWVARGCPNAAEVAKDVRWGPPLARPSKLVCVGKNYLDHAAELGEGIPLEPTLFMKATSAWNGPADDVRIPRGSTKLDYEVELAVVIGRVVSYVEENEALDCIAGYATFCDFSERAFQKDMGGQWTKGKSADTFAPIGPCLVTPEEVPDPQTLRLWCKVNGKSRQSSSTGDMLFLIRHLVSYISRFMTLLPGDVIATGTPAGVAMGMTPPSYLQAGDRVECGVEGLGEIHNRIVTTPAYLGH